MTFLLISPWNCHWNVNVRTLSGDGTRGRKEHMNQMISATQSVTIQGGTVGQSYSILSTTNLNLPLNTWTAEGMITKSLSNFIWTDTNITANMSGSRKFYNVTGP